MQNARFHHLSQHASYLFTTQVHSNTMSLHDSRLSIHVDNQTRQVITLTMYQSVGVILRIIGNAYSLTHLESRRQAGMPEFIVNQNIRERQHTHGNRSLLIVANSDKIARNGHYTHQLTLLDALIHTLDGTREHPWMESAQTLFLTLA